MQEKGLRARIYTAPSYVDRDEEIIERMLEETAKGNKLHLIFRILYGRDVIIKEQGDMDFIDPFDMDKSELKDMMDILSYDTLIYKLQRVLENIDVKELIEIKTVQKTYLENTGMHFELSTRYLSS